MNNEKMSQIIDDVWNRYQIILGVSGTLPSLTREEFIDKCKNDETFAKGWDLKIEEKVLTNEERYNMWYLNSYETGQKLKEGYDENLFDRFFHETTPQRQITITHKDQTIQFYE